MPTFTIDPVLITPGAVRTSGPRDPADTVTRCTVQMTTDGSPNWDNTVGNVIRWGVQSSADGGSNWSWGPAFQDNLPFGSRDKAGGMPQLLIERFGADGAREPIAPPGVLLRLAVEVDTAVRLGAVVATG